MVKQPTVIEKPCSKCHVLKPANEFFRREQSHDGLQSWCRSCKNAARQAQVSCVLCRLQHGARRFAQQTCSCLPCNALCPCCVVP